MFRTSERGSTVPLVSIFVTILLLLVLIAVAATSLYIERKRLFTVADGAAVAAAQAYSASDVVHEGNGILVTLNSERVRQVAFEYVQFYADRVEDTQLVNAVTPDGRSALVRLRGTWRPPVVGLFIPVQFPLEVTAIARTRLGLTPADR